MGCTSAYHKAEYDSGLLPVKSSSSFAVTASLGCLNVNDTQTVPIPLKQIKHKSSSQKTKKSMPIAVRKAIEGKPVLRKMKRYTPIPIPIREEIQVTKGKISMPMPEMEGKLVMMCPCPDIMGDPPVKNGECRLETQEHEKPSYWKVIDRVSLVLETPGDDHIPPEFHDRDQREVHPPRCHHNPPPFLNTYPPEEFEVLLPMQEHLLKVRSRY